MQIKLSKRLETIVEMVPVTGDDSCVADIGTDHGFVPIRLMELEKAGRALAMDVRKGPLQRAQEHVLTCGMQDRIETRLSDGMQKLQAGEADTVVIAGMGGELMLRILKSADPAVIAGIRTFLLSPQSELAIFRHGLEDIGLAIREERMLEEDGKYYTIMRVEHGKMHADSEAEYRYGMCLTEDSVPVLRELLEKEERQYREIADHLNKQEREGAKARLEEISVLLQQIEEAKQKLCSAERS